VVHLSASMRFRQPIICRLRATDHDFFEQFATLFRSRPLPSVVLQVGEAAAAAASGAPVAAPVAAPASSATIHPSTSAAIQASASVARPPAAINDALERWSAARRVATPARSDDVSAGTLSAFAAAADVTSVAHVLAMINRQVPRIEAGLDVIDADAWWRGFCGLLGRRTSFGPDVLPLVETVEQLLGEVLDENLEGPLHIDQRAVGPAALAAKLRAEIDNLRAMRPRNGRGLLATRLRKWREWGRPAP
jgi:hypothetical protein